MAGCLLRCSVYEIEEGRDGGEVRVSGARGKEREKASKEGTKTPVN